MQYFAYLSALLSSLFATIFAPLQLNIFTYLITFFQRQSKVSLRWNVDQVVRHCALHVLRKQSETLQSQSTMSLRAKYY